MAESFENFDNILRDSAKKNIGKSLEVSRFISVTEQTYGHLKSICIFAWLVLKLRF